MHAPAISEMESDEVFEVKMVSGLEVNTASWDGETHAHSLGLLVKEGKELALDLHVLNDGLDDEVSVGDSLLAEGCQLHG